MRGMKQSQLFQMARLCLQVFEAHGLSVDETSSVHEYIDRMEPLAKPDLAKTFHPSAQIIPEHRTAAVLLQSNGEDVGGLLTRFLDLGERGDTAGRLLKDEQYTLYKFRPAKSASPTMRSMTGRVAYMGELFLQDGDAENSWRKRPGLAAAMVRYMQCVAFAQWDLDWVYSVMNKAVFDSGNRVSQYGFSIVEPLAQDWRGVQDRRRTSSEYFLANDRDQFSHQARAVIDDPDGFFPGYSELGLHSTAKHIATGSRLPMM